MTGALVKGSVAVLSGDSFTTGLGLSEEPEQPASERLKKLRLSHVLTFVFPLWVIIM